VNLTLDVFAPRSDGFHDLDSLVMKFSPADQITITVSDETLSPGLTFSCSDPNLPTDGNNLVVKAAQRILADAAFNGSVAIHLEKRLPTEAGLGGGSSDAAATLLALTSLLGLPMDDITTKAATLGSDIPLFLKKETVRMEGRGERITVVPSAPFLYGILVRPAIGVPTGHAYRLLDALPDRVPGQSTRQLLTVLQRHGDNEEIASAMHNDFEAAILPAYREVREAHQAIADAGALRALLCGSGSALFGLARDREHAVELHANLLHRFPFVAITETWHV
jgi:4-diphosphocytidyl-2-C-methyl-D-erythritol kinase